MNALLGVGDVSLGEWYEPPDEWRIAFHVRRRLSKVEELITGPAVDIRGTKEAEERLELVAKQCPYIPRWQLMAENQK